jgi:hypothetical protein
MLAPSINPYPFPVMHPSQSISPYPIHLNECGKCSMIMLQSILIHLPKGKKKSRPKEDGTEVLNSREGRKERERGEKGEDDGLKVTPHRILEARSTFQVAIESVRDVKHPLNVFHAQRLLIVYCQGLGCADCVLDLFYTVSKILWQGIEGKVSPVDHSSCFLPAYCNHLHQRASWPRLLIP